MRVIFCILFFMLNALLPIQAKTILPLVGTGDGIELFRALSNAYNEEQGEIDLKVPPSIGSGGGIAAVLSGQASLGRVARKLKPEEVEKGLTYLPLATIPTVFFTHKDLNISTLSTQTIADIYQGRIRNWQEIGGVDMRIRIVRREDGDSSLESLRQNLPLFATLNITERTKTATTTQEAVDTVNTIDGTIGFGPFSNKLSSIVNVLKLNNIAPLDINYPVKVEIAIIYLNKKNENEGKSFLNFLATKKAQDIISAYGATPIKN